AQAPGADHHSMVGYHQYGMFLLDAYLDEYLVGSTGIRDTWLDNQGELWHLEIENQAGLEAGIIWAGFSGAYRAQALRESSLYELPDPDDDGLVEGWLGADYISLDSSASQVWLDGGIGAVVRGSDFTVFEGEAELPGGSGDAWLVVTNPDTGVLEYTYGTLDPDTGDGVDTGADDDEIERPLGCGCAASEAWRASPWPFASILGLLCLRRRSRS
ncbi:MAG: hypothetical protein QGG40_17760, partial [Myxococcota bacterium]|nr:hypothetical protein [Myxococcota bacterium]